MDRFRRNLSGLRACDTTCFDGGKSAFDHGAQFVGQTFLAQHVVGAETHGFDDVAGGGAAAEQDDHGLRISLAQAFEQFDASGAVEADLSE